MTVPVDISQRIKQTVGPLPPPGQLPDDGSYPYETIIPVRDGFVERDGVQTYFAVWGESGPSIVFAPLYQIVHMQALKATVPYLSRHFQVVTMDLRGNGRSDRPAEPSAYSFDQYYADLLAVLDHLAIRRLAIIGISSTAMTAIRLAAEEPQRVSHLIVIGGYAETLIVDTAKEAAITAASEHMRLDWPGYLDEFFTRVFTEPHSTKPYEDSVRYGWATTGEIVDWGRKGWLGHDLPAVRDPVLFNRAIGHFVGAPQSTRTWTRAMSRPRKALFLSSPIGLGHVQRDLAIARELRKLEPDLAIDWFTVDPATTYLQCEGEHVHPITQRLANESRHFEHVTGEHDLSAFFALRTMDEIMVNNFMTFSDLMEAEHYDLVIGDEAWDVDYYYHENPELKRQPFIFLTDFVGCLPVEGDELEAFLCADCNADDIEHIARFPYLRDAAIFIGNPEDVVEEPFGPGLPIIRQWTDEHFRYSGYTLAFDPTTFADTDAMRARLGYRQDEKIAIAAVGGTSVGRHLLHKIAGAFPLMKREVPDLRLILVTGPRLSNEPFAELPGLEVRPYVHNLYEHLACCDLALVQGGLSTCMELVATRRPFLCFPLQSHFEQRIHVQQRLRNYGADCAIEYNTVTPDDLANAALARMHQPVCYRPVETTGAIQAATLIAHVLSAGGAVR